MIWLVGLLACTPDGDSGEIDCSTRETVTWESFGNRFFTTYCTSCHSVNNTEHRYDAPEGVNFDSESDVLALASRVRSRVVDDETMPVGGGVYPDDLYLLDTYLACTLGE